MAITSAKDTLIAQMKSIVQMDPSSPTFQDDSWNEYASKTCNALLAYTFCSSIADSPTAPIPGEIRFLFVDAGFDLNYMPVPAHYEMGFWDGTQWVSTGTGGSGSTYVLPIASAGTLGGIKVGTNLSIDANGVLSAAASSYTLPIASAGALGGIRVGSGLSIDGSGILSATGGAGTPGGADTQIQFNDGGAFAGDTALVWDKTLDKMTFGTASGSDAIKFSVSGARLHLGTSTQDYLASTGSGSGIFTPGNFRALTYYSSATPGTTAIYMASGQLLAFYDGVTATDAGFIWSSGAQGQDLELRANSLYGGIIKLSSNVSISGTLTVGGATPAVFNTGSMTWDPAALAAGDYVTQNVTVTGALLGHAAFPSISVALPAGMMLTASVTTTDIVTVTLWNFSFTTQDLASCTLKVRTAP